jgi:hypothetical protein
LTLTCWLPCSRHCCRLPRPTDGTLAVGGRRRGDFCGGQPSSAARHITITQTQRAGPSPILLQSRRAQNCATKLSTLMACTSSVSLRTGTRCGPHDESSRRFCQKVRYYAMDTELSAPPWRGKAWFVRPSNIVNREGIMYAKPRPFRMPPGSTAESWARLTADSVDGRYELINQEYPLTFVRPSDPSVDFGLNLLYARSSC